MLRSMDMPIFLIHPGRARMASATLLALAFCLLAMASCLPAWAGVGVVTHVSGILVATKADGRSLILAPQSTVDEGDILVSEAKSFARIRFNDGGNLLVRPQSRITIERYRFDKDKPEDDAVNINLVKGGMRAITGTVGKRNADRHTTTTATATVGIRGTHYGLQQCQGDCAGQTDAAGRPLEEGLHIDVLNGTIFAVNDAGAQEFAPGQFGFVANPQSLPRVIPPGEGFRATVPPSMAASTGAGATVGQGSNNNTCVIR